MVVCIDKLRPCKPNPNWRWKESCHLFSDCNNLDELHQFARKLGLKPLWFQDRPGFPHYDLTRGIRERAVKLGAKKA